MAEIRELEGRFSSRDVANMFDVGQNTVLDIWRGRTWKVTVAWRDHEDQNREA